MELFKVFNENLKREFLCAPLNHPNIEYEWIERKITIDDNPNEIIFIGNLIDDGSIDVISLYDEDIGFFDKNKNFVTPILFHHLNMNRDIYKKLCEEINKSLKDFRIDKEGMSKNIQNLINRLDDDVPFYMDVLKYIRTNKFPAEIDVKQSNVDELISFVNKDKKEILTDYPHLKLMINILENQAI